MAKQKQNRQIKTKKHQAREQREAKQTRTIIIITSVIGAIILGLVGYGIIDNLIVRPRTPIAEVGETVIRLDEFESQVQYTRIQLLNQVYQYYTYAQQFGEYGASFLQTAQSLAAQLSQPITVGSDVLDEMIDDILVREAAEEMEITVSEDEIDEALENAFGFFPDGTPTPSATATIVSTPTLSETQLALITLTSTPTALPTESADTTPSSEGEEGAGEEAEGEQENLPTDSKPEQLDSTLAPELSPTPSLTPTVYTTKIFADNIKEFNKSYSIYDFDINNLRDIFEVALMRTKIMEVVSADLVPVKDEVWARHILVETEDEALDVLAKLNEGGDFHELAAEYSTDESNSADGGNLGWFDEERMVQAFSDVAFLLEEGEISDPVETTFGFHIIQVLGKRESQVLSADFESMKLDTFNSWLLDLRNERDDIGYYEGWEEYIPTTPEVPQDLLFALYQ